jgi:hypothetical protein
LATYLIWQPTSEATEKNGAQTFLIPLLEAFNYDAITLPESSTFEYHVWFPGQKTGFAGFVWPGRALIEMKSQGEKLSRHCQQTFDYWLNPVSPVARLPRAGSGVRQRQRALRGLPYAGECLNLKFVSASR